MNKSTRPIQQKQQQQQLVDDWRCEAATAIEQGQDGIIDEMGIRYHLELSILLYVPAEEASGDHRALIPGEIYAVMCLACNQQLPQLRGLIRIQGSLLGERSSTTTTSSIQDNHHNNIPTQSDLSPIPSRRRGSSSLSSAAPKAKVLRPFNTSEIKVLLLENISHVATQAFQEAGYQVETCPRVLDPTELKDKIRDVHIIGIRSKTKLPKEILDEAQNLLVIGCFCIDTTQVDLDAAASKGIAVFHSPFSNSRSVAELVIGEIISLARQLADRNREMHGGVWNKVSRGCFEIRGKILGIVGYGHVGAQLSVLAESLGMQVFFYDVVQIMPLGSARQVDTLDELLGLADFVSLHVPECDETRHMMNEDRLAAMKSGAYLINNARGSVVDIPALVNALRSGHLAGAAIDVYPAMPVSNGPHQFDEYPDLYDCPNLILTPYIGGSTEEAQNKIGREVAAALIKYVNQGSSMGAVNFPEVALRSIDERDNGTVRVLHVHQNVPGVLREINEIFAHRNVEKQYSDSHGNIGYVMTDIAQVSEEQLLTLHNTIVATRTNIRTRILY
ncbi:hypothetical protein O0I10_009977 [Lichtheimia ornata]|uniref:Phosphoglycerate dehydrogenase n=1 Tax=Lichtheimia ornata TaxID=688661 RepID=A0AAD7UXD0_9FUNG|nr:uncharacterized protein O0I10_009977 [Lichtheimia ornata]KAJ8654407.1 hypothetical protein O0I10_009977 [Lichtheimia ornata]